MLEENERKRDRRKKGQSRLEKGREYVTSIVDSSVVYNVVSDGEFKFIRNRSASDGIFDGVFVHSGMVKFEPFQPSAWSYSSLY